MDNSDIIEKYFQDLSEVQKNQLQALGPLYEEWNEKINVISRKDIEHFYERHVLHALAIARFMDLSDKKILDVGTGGGFPGVPLAILFPTAKFTLVDSIGKKITVVKEVSKSLGLENITSLHQRAEKVKGTFDIVVSRAVTRMNNFIPWVQQKIVAKTPTGEAAILALKGGDLDEEMKEIKRPYQEISLSDYFKEDFFETKKLIYIPF
ncbi:16S rRNA (guanine(527)-N(7))-methyltransferase RsmG [Marivirga sp. S37H4]|uniref:Ribosomal RNA small subunit methyltransferase G n=1 Tax=Marivirga aurantiaca TaxID=2802615 RepID=A0A934WW69_9BACT|nr:16S rRNA (guanine(527)-N(7))-methyltransferase RsmG [Marivirga aurantiaca]MBK6264030.1 16S rRNA (guanine(527)-N(7))-methyltransferase RsmG [Marivirga aurantiaca]